MTTDSIRTAVVVALLVALAGIGGSMVGVSQTQTPETSVTYDASPTNPNVKAVHTVNFTVGDEAVGPDEALKSFEINYNVDSPAADVSNIDASTLERFGVDENGDDVGTRIDVEILPSQITEVSSSGKAITFTLEDGEEVPVSPGDEVILVLDPVQNPDTNSPTVTPNVEATINPQKSPPVTGGDTATGSVRYEDNYANATMGKQTTSGDSVVVDRVNLSEGGWVAIHNTTGMSPDSVQGNSTYLEPGVHTDVVVPLDPAVEPNTSPELYATVHLDTNGNEKFDYTTETGQNRRTDEIYLNVDGEPQTGDGDAASTAEITYNELPNPDANGPYDVTEGGSVDLNSTGTSDSDGTIENTSWTVTDGPGQVVSTTDGPAYEVSEGVTRSTATVELNATDDEGDSATDTATVDINLLPTATISDTTVTEGGTVALADISTTTDPEGNISDVSWQLTDGQGSINGTNHYLAPDGIDSDTTATVEVTVTDNESATSTDTATITVDNNDPPTAEANGPYEVDEGGEVSLNSSGTTDDGSIDDRTWRVTSGPGSMSGSVYQAPSDISVDTTATVELEVTDDDGATSTDTASVTVINNDPPTAEANGPYQVQEGGDVSLSAAGTTDPDGSIDSTTWTVTNGPGSMSGSVYQAPSGITENETVTVELTATDDDGATDTDTATVEVIDDNQPPTAEANGPYQVQEGGDVSLSAAGTTDPDGSIDSTTWTVTNGPGSMSGSVYQAPSGITENETVTVELTATDDDGATSTDTATVDVVDDNQPPTADVGGPYSVADGGTVTLDISTADTDGMVVSTSLAVTSGPGSVTNGEYQAPSDISQDTTATVELTATDDDGESVTDTATVTIAANNQPPTADAGGPYQVAEGNTVTLETTTNDPDGSIASTSLTVTSGPGSVTNGEYQAPSDISQDTTATVELNATDDDGFSTIDSATVEITDPNEPPNAEANDPTAVAEGGAVALSSAGTTDPDGTVQSTTWTVTSGPGEINASNFYLAPADIAQDRTATIELTATDDDGATGTDTTTIDIVDAGQPPTVEANGPYTVQEAGSVSLDTSGTTDPDGSITSTSWTVTSGPGSVTNGEYQAPSGLSEDTTATVQLTATDDDGFGNTDTATVTIAADNQQPTAVANGPYEVEEGADVSLSSAGTTDPDGTIDDRSWTVTSGPGSMSGSLYQAPDGITQTQDVTVVLTVTDDDGATGTDTATITVINNEPPTAVANGPYQVDEGNTVSLDTSGTTDPDGTIATESWTVTSGPGSVTDGVYQAPTGIATDATVDVRLTATDDDGATGTDTATITVTNVNQPPIAEANGPYEVGAGGEVNLNSAGTTDPDAGDSVVDRTWRVTDGPGEISGATYQAPETLQSGETITVELTATDESGVSGTDTATIDPAVATEGDGPPTITDYSVTADGDEITVSFDSDETLADIEVDVRGPDDGVMHTEDFDGSAPEGYTGTYTADADGDYTVELLKAQDSAGDNGALEETYVDSTTVSVSESGSADGDSSDDSSSSSDDATGEDGSADDSATPTDDGGADDDSEDSSRDDDGMGGDDGASGDESADATPTPTDVTDEDATTGGDDAGDDADDDAAGDAEEGDATPTENQPGFGASLAVLALLATALLAYRRR